MTADFASEKCQLLKSVQHLTNKYNIYKKYRHLLILMKIIFSLSELIPVSSTIKLKTYSYKIMYNIIINNQKLYHNLINNILSKQKATDS